MKFFHIRISSLRAGLALLMMQLLSAEAFVVMGVPNNTEAANQLLWNYTDDLGVPKSLYKQIPRLYRWNNPHFVYSFDASFVNYFGSEGVAAVNESIEVINDFFHNEDYQGMSQMDLEKHGFAGNYNTTWVNTTAQNAQIIDLKSLVLGMMVNHLGLGNPHRHAFSIVGETTNATQTALNVEVALRNYDPVSTESTDMINGVQYSYRLIHDQPMQVGAVPPFYNIADMEEFTTDSTGNAWSSVAAIVDAFYGKTSLFWTEMPSLFKFGVYYDGYNAMGGQFEPRHALTYDDAGGLKYMYSKDTLIYEVLDAAAGVTVIEAAQYLPEHMQIHLRNPSGNLFPFMPRAGGSALVGPANNGNLPQFHQNTSIIAGTPGLPGVPLPALTDLMIRGGIEKIQFHHQPYDSLLGTILASTNFVWEDTFLYQPTNNNALGISDVNGNKIGSMSFSQSGIQWSNPFAKLNGAKFWQEPEISSEWKTQIVGRTVQVPDLIFVADVIGSSPDGVPIAYGRDIAATNNQETVSGYTGVGVTNETGPGVFLLPPANSATAGRHFTAGTLTARSAFAFTKYGGHLENFEMIWSGEASVVGHQNGVPTLWGHIKGPGPNDFETFPKGSTQDRVWNSVIPDREPPVITMVSDNGGAAPIEENTLTRTEETLTIIGNEMASVTTIEIMNGDLVMQSIMPVDRYVVSNSRIDIPAGIISDAAEGAAIQVRAWNTVGASEKSAQKFTIETGRPVITNTSADSFVFDRAQILTVSGFGFKSRAAGETVVDRIRVDDSTNAAVEDDGTRGGGASDGLPYTVSNIQTMSDTQIIIPINSMSATADGSNRRLRVARKAPAGGLASNVDAVLSPGTNPMFAAITTKPVVSSLSQLTQTSTWEDMATTGMYKRDRTLEINGTGLNTATTVELVKEDGTSFANPVFIQLPNAAVAVEDNGTRLQVSANAIHWPDADNNSTARRGFKIYNAVGNTDLNSSQIFVVNTQPVIDGIGGFATPGHFNRDKTAGDDLSIFGSGFMAVKNIIFTDDNDSSQLRVAIALPAPGIVVTDAAITIDTQTLQIGGGADTLLDGEQRIFKLESARDNATSSVAQRFRVGAPPSITTLTGLVGGNYTRDSMALGVTGSGFGHVTTLEIVDINGNPIGGVPGIFSGADGTGGTGLNISNATDVNVAVNAAGWSTTVHLLDSVTAASRRVKITTPFGSVTSSATETTGSFTVSANATMLAIPGTFAGGGYTADDLSDPNDDNGTYDKSEGDLYINGTNLRGVSRVMFYSGAGVGDGNFTVDPLNPPAGISFNATGTQIIVGSTVLPAGWVGEGNATVGVVSVAGHETNSTSIQTQE